MTLGQLPDFNLGEYVRDGSIYQEIKFNNKNKFERTENHF